MKLDRLIQAQDPFRWRSLSLLLAISGIVLILIGQTRAAGGLALGVLLFAANLFLMTEIARSLARRGGEGKPKPVAALSSTGRLLFLAVALAAIAVYLGRAVVLGACGGLLMAQVNLAVPRRGSRGRSDDS